MELLNLLLALAALLLACCAQSSIGVDAGDNCVDDTGSDAPIGAGLQITHVSSRQEATRQLTMLLPYRRLLEMRTRWKGRFHEHCLTY